MKETQPKQFFDWRRGYDPSAAYEESGLQSSPESLELLAARMRIALADQPQDVVTFTPFIHARITGQSLDGVSFVMALKGAFEDWQASNPHFRKVDYASQVFQDLAPDLIEVLIDNTEVRENAFKALQRYYLGELYAYLQEVRQHKEEH